MTEVKEPLKSSEIAALKEENINKLNGSEDKGLEAKATPPEVDTGLFLKTMSDSMMIPLDAGFKKETIHVEKEKADDKSGHEKEAAEKKGSPAEKKSTPAEKKAWQVEEKLATIRIEPSIVGKTAKKEKVSLKEKETVKVKAEEKQGSKVKETVEEKAESIKVFEFAEFPESLGVENAPTEEPAAVKRKETEAAKKEVHKTEKLVAKEIVIPAEKPKKAAKLHEKMRNGKVILDAASALKTEAPALKKLPSKTEGPDREKAADLQQGAKSAPSEKTNVSGETPLPLPITEEGLVLKAAADKMMIPFEEAFKKAETLQIKEKESTAEKKVFHESLKHSGIEEASKEEVSAIKRKDLTVEKRGMTESGAEKKNAPVKPQVETEPDKEASAVSLKERVNAVEILTPEKNRTPSQKDYFQKPDDKDRQRGAGIRPEVRDTNVEGKKPPFGIPVPDVLLLRDIKIEVLSIDTEMSGLLFSLFRKAHPMEDRKIDSGKQKEVDIAAEREEVPASGSSGSKKLFSVAKAEKGVYTFVIKNKVQRAHDVSVVFRLFEGKTGERIKEFKAVQLLPDAVLKLKFILPEAVFWDDEYYFTGTIESSNTMTKFNDRTGLIWKEEKDY